MNNLFKVMEIQGPIGHTADPTICNWDELTGVIIARTVDSSGFTTANKAAEAGDLQPFHASERSEVNTRNFPA